MATAKERQLVSEIVNLCMEINEIGDYTVFMDFSGHVNWIGVSLCGPGELYGLNAKGWPSSGNVYLSDSEWNKPKDCVANLTRLRDRLIAVRSGVERPSFTTEAQS